MAGSRLQARRKALLLVVVSVGCAIFTGACGGSKGAATTASKPSATTGKSPAASGEAAPSHVVSERVVRATSNAVTASINAAGHSPRVNVPWPIRFTVKSNDKPARAEVRYQYLFGGQVVAHRSRYRFTGSFHDSFNWPASAVGYPLTFRAVIVSEGVTLNLDYPVQVRR
jgi:hypothetical protein